MLIQDLLHETPEALSQEDSLKITNTLTPEQLRKMNAYWRAANYVSVGQIYLYENPLLKEPLTLAHVKPLVVSHWGTTPGQNFIYGALEPGHQEVRLKYVLHRRSGPRRTGYCRQRLPRRHLERSLSERGPR